MAGKVYSAGVDVTAASSSVVGSYTLVASSATPTFTLGTSLIQGFAIVLTANVTSSTISGTPVAGMDLWLKLCQDSTGGRTFTYPANVVGNDGLDTTASKCTTQVFRYDGTNFIGVTSAKSDNTTPGFFNSGLDFTLPSTSQTLVGRTDTATLTNKTIDCTNNTCTVRVADLPAADKVRTCEVVIGDPGAASAALANDNDSPQVCSNNTGADLTITGVSCYADAGSPTVTPVFTDASAILTGALTCGTASWAAGTLSGTPVEHSFSGSGFATCSVAPCAINANITTAGGTAKYVVIKIVRSL